MLPCAFWSYTVRVQCAVEIGFLNIDAVLNSFFGDLPQGLYLRAGVLSSPACLVNIQRSFSPVQLLSCVWLFVIPWSQHARPPCPSPTPGVYSNSCPSSQWCHPAISSSVVPFSSCPQSLPASRSFPTSQLFSWGGQSIGVSASASVLPMNTQTDLL